MSDSDRVDPPTIRTHKHQLAWQILVPFLVVTALIITVAILAASGGSSETRAWADISIIWLIAPLLTLALVSAVVLIFLIYGIFRLLKVTPKYTAKAQYYVAKAAAGTHNIADGTTKPFIWVQQAGAVIKSFFNKF